jgi:hypothetical protein
MPFKALLKLLISPIISSKDTSSVFVKSVPLALTVNLVFGNDDVLPAYSGIL